MKKVTIDKLINEMVKIIITEVDTMIDKSCLVFKYKTDRMTAKLISNAITKYGIEWSSDIIRDEVIATLYESMLVVAKDLEEDQLRFDNAAFMGKVYRLVEIKLKGTLIQQTKKSSDGKIIGYTEELVSPLAEEGEKISKLEQLLNGSMSLEDLKMEKEEKVDQFIKWFNKNKKDILTKKQLKFVDGELIDMDRFSACHMRKRIANRVLKAYEVKYGTVSSRIATLMDQKETIETILESNDFRAALIPNLEETYIIDTIIDNVSPEAAKAFNAGSNEAWVIKEYRIALFKELGNIIDILENEGM